MFSITGTLAGKQVKITWNQGKIDHPQMAKIIDDEIARRGEHYMSPSQQACRASLDHASFCYEIMRSYFAEVEAVDGDVGIITSNDPIIIN